MAHGVTIVFPITAHRRPTPPSMKSALLRLASCTLLLCAGCSKTAEKPAASAPADATYAVPIAGVAETPSLSQLMHAVFDKLVRSDGDAAVMLQDPDNHAERAPFLVHAEGSKLLPTGDAVLIASALKQNSNGEAEIAHVTPGLLNIFFLKKQDGQWKVTARFENFEELGSSGSIGQIRWINFGKDKPGLAVEHGGTWSGYTVTDLSLYDLSGGKARALTSEFIPIHSDSEGGCGPGADCWNTDGKWRFVSGGQSAYDDLVIDFEEEKWTGSDEEDGSAAASASAKAEAPRSHRKASARYRFDGTGYKLVDGANIVPPV